MNDLDAVIYHYDDLVCALVRLHHRLYSLKIPLSFFYKITMRLFSVFENRRFFAL